MAKTYIERERLSVDVLPEEHRQIKAYAALHGETIRQYVLKSVKERLLREAEEKELSTLTVHIDNDPVLKKLWNNRKDAHYDEL